MRFPKNVEGDFYTTGECLACHLPENEAPDLLAKLDDQNMDTYFVKQPEVNDEIDRAIEAIKVCCVDAIRYAGTDKSILTRLDPTYCDCAIAEDGSVVENP